MRPINLLQERILGIIPPAGTLRTVVRHSKTAHNKVTWLRLFDDARSTFSTTWTVDADRAPLSERFAGVIDIAQRLERSSASDGRDGRDVRAALAHVSTSVRGVVPLPVALMETRCEMDGFTEDGTSYELRVHVTLCGQPMVSYTGRLRECEGPPSDFLSAREAQAMGVSSPAVRPATAAEAQGAIRHLVEVPGTPPAGAFSRATVHNGLVYVSGTGASNDTATGAVEGGGTAYSETTGALENVERILRAAGSGPERIVVATMLLTERSDYAECNAAYVDYFAARGLAERLPARSSALWAVPTTAKVAFSVVATVVGE